ncbi:hypothetical protein [Psychrobacter alimentarius]|uniref:hypothetical protein n=1 Tax=Psychrobacter alimentarius TaxID=261164 RepID=UPI00191850AA|nr:hypothetical protein [Psychrobacter alimentarius]
MVLDLTVAPNAHFNIDNKTITVYAFDASKPTQNLHNQTVNIIASGPSIADLAFAKLLDMPTIFVNGSISLTEQYDFTNIVGYVISDARFISHQPEILQKYYTGQPLYATLAVFEAMKITHPALLLMYHQVMRVLHPVDRPLATKSKPSFFSKQGFKEKLLNKKKSLTEFKTHPNFVIDDAHKPKSIGVSLDITYGFVEGGTVAYIAAQLAFSRQAGAIHLYGIDLLNSDQPRFYESTDNSAPSKLSKAITERIVPSFNLLGRVYKHQGIPVTNFSPVSKTLFDSLNG